MSATDLKQTVLDVARNLTSLEINTILKKNMTGGGMPYPRHALINISRIYRDELISIQQKAYYKRLPGFADMKTIDQSEIFRKVKSPTGEALAGSYAYFDSLRDGALELLDDLYRTRRTNVLAAEQEADLVMLERIRDMSDQIKGVFDSIRDRSSEWKNDKDIKEYWIKNPISEEKEKLKSIWDNNYTGGEIVCKKPPFPINTNEYLLIRKAWEIGAEVIVMQTVIHLTGDVFTRIVPQYATKEKETIQTIHNQSVRISLDMWSQIVTTVKDLFTKFITR